MNEIFFAIVAVWAGVGGFMLGRQSLRGELISLRRMLAQEMIEKRAAFRALERRSRE